MTAEIRSESALRVGEQLTSTEDLSSSQREALALWLKESYLNELCRGKISFSPEKPDHS